MSAIFSVHSLQSGINRRSAQTYSYKWNLLLIIATNERTNEQINVDSDEPTTRSWNKIVTLLSWQRLCFCVCVISIEIRGISCCHSLCLKPLREIYSNVIRQLRELVNYYEIFTFLWKNNNIEFIILCETTKKLLILFKLRSFFLVSSAKPSN